VVVDGADGGDVVEGPDLEEGVTASVEGGAGSPARSITALEPADPHPAANAANTMTARA